jgi:hypothetical protein
MEYAGLCTTGTVMITYQQEAWGKEFFDEAMPFFKAHWKEIGMFKDKMEFFPDEDLYEQLNKLDAVKLYTVRDGTELVGYAVYLLNGHPHYMTTIMAMNDAYYVRPEYRKGTIAIKLLALAERKLKESGAQFITMRSKVAHDFGRMLTRRDYAPIETLFGKYIGD